jgi:DNA-directed RNA polymerase beta subunit
MEGVIRISIPFVKGAIPLFALFRALGVESDKEIVRMILPDTNSPATSSMENTLIASIQDAYPITSQIQAIEFIRTLTKGFIVENVLDILHTHLFSHVPDRPLARAQYLAEFIRRMIRVEMRMEPNTNRDDIRNQRLLSTGTLLRGLFSECLKDWKKAVRLQVDVTYNYNKSLYTDENFLNIFSPGNIAKILASAALNDSIMRGFRGKWGTNQYNMKQGVVQPHSERVLPPDPAHGLLHQPVHYEGSGGAGVQVPPWEGVGQKGPVLPGQPVQDHAEPGAALDP